MSIKRQSLTCLIFSLFGFSCVQENRRGESLRKQRKSRGKKLEEKTRAFENMLSFLNGYPIAWIEMCQISGNSYLKAEPCSGLWEDDGMQWPEIVRSYRIVGTRRNISNVMKFWRTLHFGFDKLLYWIQIQCCKKSFSNILSSDDLMLGGWHSWPWKGSRFCLQRGTQEEWAGYLWIAIQESNSLASSICFSWTVLKLICFILFWIANCEWIFLIHNIRKIHKIEYFWIARLNQFGWFNFNESWTVICKLFHLRIG